MPDVILAALVSLFDPQHFLFLGLGVMLGMVVGILPGLGGTAMLSLLLPFVFGKDPGPVLAMKVGLLAVNNTSDTFPAVLMGIPGSSSSQVHKPDSRWSRPSSFRMKQPMWRSHPTARPAKGSPRPAR